MALSAKAKKRLEVTMAHRVQAAEVATAIDTATASNAADAVLIAADQAAIALLKNGTPTFTAQTPLTVAGAINLTAGLSTFSNAGAGYAITLAAPSNQDGQIKVIKAVTAVAAPVTLAMTNITTSPGELATTLTFSAVGHCAILMAVGAKWVMIGGSAVAS